MGYPRVNAPPLHVIYGTLLRQIQFRYNQLTNSGAAFAYDTETITVAADTDTYTISSDNYGKALGLVTYSTDDGHVERSIDFFEVQNLTFDWNQTNNAAAGYWQLDATSTFSAERVAIYKDASTGATKLIFRPIPKAAATYVLMYSIGDWTSDATLTSSPVLTQFAPMYELPTALFSLPNAKWDDDEKVNQLKRENLKQSIMGELQMMGDSWTDFTSGMSHAKMGMRESCYDV